MNTYIGLTATGPGQVLLASSPLGRGGEGTVYAVQSHTVPNLLAPAQLVAKIYHNAQEGNRLNKVRAMVSAPPQSSSVAWPLAVLFNQDKTFAGYLMMKLANDTYRPWADLAHARQRRESAASFDVRYGITAIRNLAVALSSIHAAGHRVGDINESNIFAGGDASVLIVDTDSAQVQGKETFPCTVGKPEYTAPEISHGALRDHLRTEATDVFGFAVASYQMMTGGAHPTDAVYEGEDEPPSVVDKIRAGSLPGLNAATAPHLRHPARIPVQAIPTALRGLLYQSLLVNPAQRPSMEKIVAGLDSILPHLRQCGRVQHHWYDERDGECGWCRHADGGQPDPWSDQAVANQNLPKQYVLPPVTFESGAAAPQIRRAPAAPASAGLPQLPSYSQVQYPPPSHSQQSTGYSSPSPSSPGVPQPQASSPQTSPTPQKKHKGKTILNYADGTQGPRPPIGVLMRANPKLALSCLKSETPDAARFWWPPSRSLASPLGLGLGMGAGIVLAFVWTLLPLLVPAPADWLTPIWPQLGILAGLGAFVAAALLTFSGFWDRYRAAKSAGSLTSFTPEAASRTAARYAVLAIIYGPGLVLGLAATLVLTAFNVVAALIKDGSKYR